MAELLDKAVVLMLGLEKKAKEVLEELKKAGEAGEAGGGGGGGGGVKTAGAGGGKELTPSQRLENRVVEEGAKALKDFLRVVEGAKEKLEKEIAGSSGRILEKLHAAKEEDIEVVKEIARVAREKVDRLEKRLSELEGLIRKK